MKPSILFVDDDHNVLDGLRRMLHPMRQQWDMTFHSGARQALAAMESKPPDILVTDLLMPEMDGAKLLEEVHARHPQVIRIVLSGHSGKSLALKASRYAHQFLAKPLHPVDMARTIKRAVALRNVLLNPEVQKLIARLDTLPALPEVHRKIMGELNTPEPSMKRLAELISQDMGLSASMLKLVNSAFFGLRTRVSSPAHAVNLLGLEVISGLVITVQLFSSFDSSKYPGYSLNGLWRHSLSVGLICRAIAQAENLNATRQDDLYVAGILHDVGKLVLLCSAHELYTRTLEVCRADNVAIWMAEKGVLGCTHAELGAYLLSLWGFSDEIIPCIAQHHDLGEYAGDQPLMATIVHAANALDHELSVVNPGYARERWDGDAVERLGFAGRLPVWRDAAVAAMKEAAVHDGQNPDS